MSSADPVRDLAHDHADLNRRVLELSDLHADPAAHPPLLPALVELREHMFLHFAREEEGLFPLVSEWIPEISDQVLAMVSAHDAVCGALARMIHAARSGTDAASLDGLLGRFQAAYAEPAQRAQLAELVRSL